MAVSKNKTAPNAGMLVKASKINVFQVTILVLLFVVAGVVLKYYSHGASNPYACAKPYPTLQYGSTNASCVKHLQWDLVNMWPNNGGQYIKNTNSSDNYGIDGSFGPATKKGVQYFQYTKKVPNSNTGGGLCSNSMSYCDGIAGASTWNALEPTYSSSGVDTTFVLGAKVYENAGLNLPVRFTLSQPVGSCGTSINVIANISYQTGYEGNQWCYSSSSVSLSGTYPVTISYNGKVYSVYCVSVGSNSTCTGPFSGRFSVSIPRGQFAEVTVNYQ